MDGQYKYIYLPSNASFDYFPNNTLGEFTVKLSNPVDFSQYDVGLADIHFPNSWLNVVGAYLKVRIEKRWHIMALEDAKYTNFESLTEMLNQVLRSFAVYQFIKFRYNKSTMRYSLDITRTDIEVRFEKNFGSMLGFNKETYMTGLHYGENRADLDNRLTALYIYSDIVQNQLVGDTLAPLLRIVGIRGNKKTNENKEVELRK